MLPVPPRLEDVKTYFSESIFHPLQYVLEILRTRGNWQHAFSWIPVNFDQHALFGLFFGVAVNRRAVSVGTGPLYRAS